MGFFNLSYFYLKDKKNNTCVSGIQRVFSASPPHDTDAFHRPQLPSKFQSKLFKSFEKEDGVAVI